MNPTFFYQPYSPIQRTSFLPPSRLIQKMMDSFRSTPTSTQPAEPPLTEIASPRSTEPASATSPQPIPTSSPISLIRRRAVPTPFSPSAFPTSQNQETPIHTISLAALRAVASPSSIRRSETETTKAAFATSVFGPFISSPGTTSERRTSPSTEEIPAGLYAFPQRSIDPAQDLCPLGRLSTVSIPIEHPGSPLNSAFHALSAPTAPPLQSDSSQYQALAARACSNLQIQNINSMPLPRSSADLEEPSSEDSLSCLRTPSDNGPLLFSVVDRETMSKSSQGSILGELSDTTSIDEPRARPPRPNIPLDERLHSVEMARFYEKSPSEEGSLTSCDRQPATKGTSINPTDPLSDCVLAFEVLDSPLAPPEHFKAFFASASSIIVVPGSRSLRGSI